MQKILDLTNKHIVLATPLILYSLISSIYLVVSASSGKVINVLFAFILFMLMTTAFIAGWFNMIKIVIINPELNEPNSLIKDFPAGVGEYFLSSLGSVLIMFILSIFLFIASYYIGINFIGNPEISAQALSDALQNSSALKTFVSSLSIEQLEKLNYWNMLILATTSLGSFLIFLYMPALFFENKNPIKAYLVSLKKLFSKNFFKTLGLFLLIIFLNSIISIFATVFSGNMLLHFSITLLNFYFITIVCVGVFYYYYHSFCKPLIGQNVDLEV